MKLLVELCQVETVGFIVSADVVIRISLACGFLRRPRGRLSTGAWWCDVRDGWLLEFERGGPAEPSLPSLVRDP